jgi:hypothetical protein
MITNDNERLTLANLYVSNIAEIVTTIQNDLQNNSLKNIEIYRKNTEENNRRLGMLTRLLAAGRNLTNRLSSVIRQLDSNSISQDEAQRQISEAEGEFNRARNEYNAAGPPRELPFAPKNVMVSVPKFPELVFPSVATPGNSSNLPTTMSVSTTVRSIAGFSDYKGAIASWTESFAPFEN